VHPPVSETAPVCTLGGRIKGESCCATSGHAVPLQAMLSSQYAAQKRDPGQVCPVSKRQHPPAAAAALAPTMHHSATPWGPGLMWGLTARAGASRGAPIPTSHHLFWGAERALAEVRAFMMGDAPVTMIPSCHTSEPHASDPLNPSRRDSTQDMASHGLCGHFTLSHRVMADDCSAHSSSRQRRRRSGRPGRASKGSLPSTEGGRVASGVRGAAGVSTLGPGNSALPVASGEHDVASVSLRSTAPMFNITQRNVARCVGTGNNAPGLSAFTPGVGCKRWADLDSDEDWDSADSGTGREHEVSTAACAPCIACVPEAALPAIAGTEGPQQRKARLSGILALYPPACMDVPTVEPHQARTGSASTEPNDESMMPSTAGQTLSPPERCEGKPPCRAIKCSSSRAMGDSPSRPMQHATAHDERKVASMHSVHLCDQPLLVTVAPQATALLQSCENPTPCTAPPDNENVRQKLGIGQPWCPDVELDITDGNSHTTASCQQPISSWNHSDCAASSPMTTACVSGGAAESSLLTTSSANPPLSRLVTSSTRATSLLAQHDILAKLQPSVISPQLRPTPVIPEVTPLATTSAQARQLASAKQAKCHTKTTGACTDAPAATNCALDDSGKIKRTHTISLDCAISSGALPDFLLAAAFGPSVGPQLATTAVSQPAGNGATHGHNLAHCRTSSSQECSAVACDIIDDGFWLLPRSDSFAPLDMPVAIHARSTRLCARSEHRAGSSSNVTSCKAPVDHKIVADGDVRHMATSGNRRMSSQLSTIGQLPVHGPSELVFDSSSGTSEGAHMQCAPPASDCGSSHVQSAEVTRVLDDELAHELAAVCANLHSLSA
jgi:hypothetical protein